MLLTKGSKLGLGMVGAIFGILLTGLSCVALYPPYQSVCAVVGLLMFGVCGAYAGRQVL